MTGEAKASSLGGIRIMMCRVPVVGQFLPFMQTLQFWFLDKTLQLDLVPKQMEPQVWFLTPKKKFRFQFWFWFWNQTWF
jgi:hypothetical protein